MQKCNRHGYMAVGLCVGLPPAILPIFLQPKERTRQWYQHYWVKANVWIAIFSFIGNYFWTHYFYQLLGASYTFPAHMLNQVCLFSNWKFYQKLDALIACVSETDQLATGFLPQSLVIILLLLASCDT